MAYNATGNVISTEAFRNLMDSTLDHLAKTVSETLGPYGHNVLIQTSTGVQSTKDGWNTLQSINYGEDTIRSAFKSMIESVPMSVVLNVGDGSTTATIAANVLNQELQNQTEVKNRPIREVEDTLTLLTNKIVEKLYAKAKTIDMENPYDEIYNIARVSTNWNEEISRMIAEIYQTTHNPIIKIQDSGTDRTYIEYIEGYDLTGELMLPEYSVTDFEHGKAIVQNPNILVFNHTVMDKHFLLLITMAQQLQAINNRGKLVILAPGFENALITRIAVSNNEQIKTGHQPIPLIMAKIVNNYTIDRECIGDFCKLTGARAISTTEPELTDLSRKVADIVNNERNNNLQPESLEEFKQFRQETMKEILEYTQNAHGECEEMILGPNGILANGLPGADDKIVDDTRALIRSEIDTKLKEFDANTILTDDIRMKRVRLGKLACKMGIIKVGGYGTGNIKAKKDALDDATRACEAAYRDGYTSGSCIAILNAVNEIWKELSDDEGIEDTLHGAILSSIYYAFKSVLMTLFRNKFDSLEKHDKEYSVETNKGEMLVSDIISECVKNNYSFNLLTNSFDEDLTQVVNPVAVDVGIVKACLRLVIISITSNTFIYKYYGPDTSKIALDGMTLSEVKQEA